MDGSSLPPIILWKCENISESVISDSLQPHGQKSLAHQALQSMEFWKQEYWSG